jgi:serine phosphatase RsbU (regulator of sigma subunit)
MKIKLLLLTFFAITNILFSQNVENKIDSLKKLLKTSKPDTSIINKYLELSLQYRSISTDSAVKYTNKALILFNKTKNISNSDKNIFFIEINKSIGLNYYLLGKYELAEVYFKKTLDRAEKTKNIRIMTAMYVNLGALYETKSNINKALTYHLKSLRLAEKTNNKSDMATSYNNVGYMHYQLESYERALYYYNKSLKLKSELNDNEGIALLLNNIGIIYYFKNEIDTCIKYFKKASLIWEKTGNKRSSAMILSNLGELYLEIGLYKNSINYLNESKKLYLELKDSYNLIATYKLLGQVYFEGGDYINSQKSYNKALKYSQEIGENKESVDLYLHIAQLDSTLGNFKNAYRNLIKFHNLKDSIFSLDRKKAFDELQTKFETEKKEKQIIKNNAQIKKQKIINIALFIGILLIIIVAILYIRQNRIRKKANQMLMLKNAEILQQKEEIETQRDEIESQRDEIEAQLDIASKQRDLILQQKEEISESIRYAQRIQNAILPNNEILNKLLTNYFILFKPKDVVSGDFYWVKEINNLTIMLVADCTGHGVPGGFMSMLGIAFLNEIVKKPEVITSGNVLNELRTYVIEALKQSGKIEDQHDGMDISICIINNETYEVQYSGAFNPIYIISENEIITNNSNSIIKKYENTSQTQTNVCLYEHKADKMPISFYIKMQNFNTYSFKLKKNDIIYLFSDGYPDQFGGDKNKKFTYSQFKNILLNISQKPMYEQKLILDNTLKNWMGNAPQIDDITILAYKI